VDPFATLRVNLDHCGEDSDLPVAKSTGICCFSKLNDSKSLPNVSMLDVSLRLANPFDSWDDDRKAKERKSFPDGLKK
jgi:hypothetical protein